MFAKKNNLALNCFLEDLRPSSGEQAHQMARGTFSFGSGVETIGNVLPFDLTRPSNAWQKELHGFSWIRHFSKGAESGNADLASLARYYVDAWCNERNPSKVAWELETAAARVVSWLTNGQMLAANQEDKKWQHKFKQILISHGKFLLRQTHNKKSHRDGSLSAGVALVLLGLSLNGYDHWTELGFNILMKEVNEQILPDGGHISRNPSQHLSILFDLLTLKKNLLNQGRPGPDKLPAVIDRMLPMLRFFIHGDGKLALFNGGKEEQRDILQAALANDDTGGKPFAFAPHSAYQRLNAGRTLLLVDIGRPPPTHFSQKAHAGCLSMEMSSGKQRFIVNCGGSDHLDETWVGPSRSTAAHSTLTLQDTSSARRKKLAAMFGRHLSGLNQVDSNRNENKEKGVWLDAGHDGYVKDFGLNHRRRLFLEKSGKELHGEDLLELSTRRKRSKKEEPQKNFALRFHFHPDVRCGLVNNGKGLVAKLPNDEGWMFKAQMQTAEGSPIETCSLQKQESVYLGGNRPRRAEQLVIVGKTGMENDAQRVAKINWVWQRKEKNS